MAGVTGPVFNGADVHQNMTDLALHPIESDSGSLLDSDLAAMPDADHLAPTIGALHQAHANGLPASRRPVARTRSSLRSATQATRSPERATRPTGPPFAVPATCSATWTSLSSQSSPRSRP
jgi:hypothetical protein